MKKLLIFGALVATTLAGALFAAPQTFAADESIALSPTNKRYSLDPGASRTDTLKIVNDGQAAYTFVLYARPYGVQSEDYKPVFSEVNATSDAYKWVRFDQTEYTLKPGESVDVPYSLNVPSNADSGGHYGVIFAETQPSDENSGSVVRKKRVGAIVYATVNGDNKSAGSVLSTSIPFLQTNAPLTVSSRVQNTGNVDFVDSTTMRVTDIFGNEKYKTSRELAVLPGTTRNMEYAWEDGAGFGLYTVSVSHSFFDKSSEKKQLVLLMPAWALIVLAALIVGFIIYKITTKKPTKRGKKLTKK